MQYRRQVAGLIVLLSMLGMFIGLNALRLQMAHADPVSMPVHRPAKDNLQILPKKQKFPSGVPANTISLYESTTNNVTMYNQGCRAAQGAPGLIINDTTSHSPVTSTSYLTSISDDTQVTRQTTGVFSLSAGGPIPVPANVLHPTNIARVVVNNVLTSIYAGSMTRTPSIGALAILQENLTTGEQSLHFYSTSQPMGEITILAVQNGMLTFSTPNARGTFDLSTKQFHF
jgi:hypothetical protein